MNPRRKFQWWGQHGAGQDLLEAIKHGVKPQLTALPPTNRKNCPVGSLALNTAIEEYLQLGVIHRIDPPVAQQTRHWSPVFGRKKADSTKIRMITDLRKLNSVWRKPPTFKSDNWQTVGECLALNPQLTWAVVVDLSNFFFQLGLHPSAGRWIRIKTAMGNFQWTALPFGLHCSPY